MDFTITPEYGGREQRKNLLTSISSKEIESQSNDSNQEFVNIIDLIDKNRDLIQDCLETKKDDILSENELAKYGQVALSTAALDCTNEKEYRSFAKKRLENMMNRAIAEARLILEIQGKICDNNQLGMEFASIEKAYC
jgi:hypothetical protein